MKVDLPKHVIVKRLRGGGVAYYWNLPSWARRRAAEATASGAAAPCPVGNERLPAPEQGLFGRAAELNAALDAWRTGNDSGAILQGSVAWLIRWFQKHPKYERTAAKTQRSYDQGLTLIENHQLDGGLGKFGALPAKAVRPYHADALYERVQWVGERRRLATANAAMRAARRMWSLALRAGLVDANPFERMSLEGTGGDTRPATRAEVERFVAQADTLGLPSLGTAAMLAFELCQREGDVIGTLGWSSYRPGEAIEVRQAKTNELVWVPLADEEGPLFPGLIERLAATPRRGTLIVMRDRPKRAKGPGGEAIETWQPYNEHLLRKHVALVRSKAGLPADLTFMGFRHGGLTELGDAGATDQELVSHSGHKTRAMLTVYTRRTSNQALNAARKRRALRTSGARKSE